MKKIENNDIHSISRHSNWSSTGVEEMLHNEVYSNKEDWNTFLKLFFISLGVAFTTAGIIFFFAYNWNDLHKFVKIGLIEGLIVGLTLFVVFSKKTKETTRNIILTGVTMLVGVLFAVFGQIYQTGANAYDFFLGWTISVALWVLISNFAVLWFVFLVLINTTLVLYEKQVVSDWSPMTILLLLVLLNTLFLIGSFVFSKKEHNYKWLQTIVSLVIVSLSTFGVVMGVFDVDIPYYGLFLLLAIVLYVFGWLHAVKEKNTFFIAIIALSILIIIVALIVKIMDFDSLGILLLISLFIIASVTLVVRYLMNLQKKWDNE